MRILIIGLGSTGQRHLKNLLAMGYDDFVLCRSGKTTLKNASLDDYPTVLTVSDALVNYKPTAAFICTPTSMHLQTAKLLAEAGCHFLIEKPISHQKEGCDEVARLVREKNLVTLVGFQFRFHPVLQAIRKFCLSGEMGRIVSVHVHWGEYLPGWHPWENYFDSYAAKQDLGGGAALTLCHPIDYLRWLFGEIRQISAIVSPLKVLSTEVDEAVQYSLLFENGIIGSVYVDFIRRPSAHTLTIIAEKGTLFWDNATSNAIVDFADGTRRNFELPVGFERNDLFKAEVAHFMECLKARNQTLVLFEDGMRTLTLILDSLERAII